MKENGLKRINMRCTDQLTHMIIFDHSGTSFLRDMKGRGVVVYFKENRGRGFAYSWSVMSRNYLMLRPRNVHPCLLEQTRSLWYFCYLSALFSSWIEQYPLHFHPCVHPCHTGDWCMWDCAVCRSVTKSTTNPTHLSIQIGVFSVYISILPPGSLDHVQVSHSFSILTVWLAFAVTSHCYNLCAMHNKNLSHLSCLPWLLEICCM